MPISQAQLVELFVAAGAPFDLFYGPFPRFSLPDLAFETCSADFVLASYADCLDSLPPECVTVRQLGAGRSRRVMRHTMAEGDTANQAGDCDTHGHVFMSHCVVGNWKKAIRTGTRRGGLAFGVIDYVAVPKPGDGRAGGHDRNWFITHELELRWFEPGDGDFATMLPEEVASLTYGRAV